jgi:dihydroflavonol-4-reductase
MSKKVFITGITGLVGSYIARRFAQEGYKIKALRRSHSDMSLIKEIYDQIEWIEGDILNINALDTAISEGDIVVHSAAVVSFSPKERNQMYQTNIEGTANITNICLDKKVKKLVHISSVASLSRKKGQTTVNEKSQWEESDLNSEYARTKYLSEAEVWRAVAEGLNAVILNPSLVLGVGDFEKTSLQLFNYVYQKRPFYPTGTMNYVDVRDVAEIAFQLAEKEISNERFVVSAGEVKYQDLFNQIADLWHIKRPHIKITPFIAEISWRASLIASWVTRKTPLVTKETARISQHSFLYENNKIKQTLGFEFKKLSETLQWACEGMKRN